MIIRGSVLAAAMMVAASAATAQWDVGLQLTTTHYRGSAHDTTTASAVDNLRPGDATSVGLRLDHVIGRTRIGFQATYAKPGVAATAPGLSLSDKTTGQLVEMGIVVNFRVAGIGSSGAIRAELGPALHLWNLDDDVRSRLGALGGVTYEWPVAQRLTGTIRLEGMISASWFETTDLPPELERQVTWRYGWGVGLRYRL